MSAHAPTGAHNAYANALRRFAPASAKEEGSSQGAAARGAYMLPIVKGLSGSFGGVIEVGRAVG